jgi:fatty-acyl-CoA synthase
MGLAPDDRVATLAWNTYRHFELFFAVPCSRTVLHTLNLRFAPDQLAYIVQHAKPMVIFADASLTPILEGIRDEIPSVRQFVIMTDGSSAASLTAAVDYETLLAKTPDDDDHPWGDLDENAAAAMCYTTGITDFRRVWFTATGHSCYTACRGRCRRLGHLGEGRADADDVNVSRLRVGHAVHRSDDRR